MGINKVVLTVQYVFAKHHLLTHCERESVFVATAHESSLTWKESKINGLVTEQGKYIKVSLFSRDKNLSLHFA